MNISLNYSAIATAAALYAACSLLWYRMKPVHWYGRGEGTGTAGQAGHFAIVLPVTVAAGLAGMYVFAHILTAFRATTFADGIAGGVWMWLGFILPLLIVKGTAEKAPVAAVVYDAAIFGAICVLCGIALVMGG